MDREVIVEAFHAAVVSLLAHTALNKGTSDFAVVHIAVGAAVLSVRQCQ